MLYDNKILENLGFQKMSENFDGSEIKGKYEKWHLYLRYVIVLDLVQGRFYMVNWNCLPIGSSHYIESLYNIDKLFPNIFNKHEISSMKQDYRDYQLNTLS